MVSWIMAVLVEMGTGRVGVGAVAPVDAGVVDVEEDVVVVPAHGEEVAMVVVEEEGAEGVVVVEEDVVEDEVQWSFCAGLLAFCFSCLVGRL
jgi:hypothetical protein